MDTGDPAAWQHIAAAFKSGIDGVRAAIELVRTFRASGRSSPEDEAKLTEALDFAEQSLELSTAQLAKALGYTLCQCAFPPTPMLTVGYMSRREAGKPVHECPKCHRNTAGPMTFERTVPA